MPKPILAPDAFKVLQEVAKAALSLNVTDHTDLMQLLGKKFKFESDGSFIPMGIIGGVNYRRGMGSIEILPTCPTYHPDPSGVYPPSRILYFATYNDVIRCNGDDKWVARLDVTEYKERRREFVFGNIVIID